MSRASDISAAAAQWLIRLEAETSPELWDAFQSWLDDDPRHRAAFVRLRTAWTRVDQLKSLRPANGSIDSDLLTPRRVSATALATDGLHPLEGRRRRRPRDLPSPLRRRLLATAAAVAGITVASWASIYASSWRVYETDVGGLKQVALNDGTTVDLNTNTALETRLSGTRRDIRLVRGGALFHVAHDSTRPFYVIAGTTIVRAVGTSFSVRLRDSDHVDVLVAEGRVAVGPPGTRDPDRPALFQPRRPSGPVNRQVSKAAQWP